MAASTARVFWSQRFDSELRTKYGLPRNIFAVKIDPAFIESHGKEMAKFQEEQSKRISDNLGPRPMTMKLCWEVKKRSLDQNAYMWKLYELFCKVFNDGLLEAISHATSKEEVARLKELMETPDKLHNKMLLDYAPRATIAMDRAQVGWIREEYHVLKETIQDDGKIALEVVIGTRHFNTLQMAAWITRLINKLSEIGATKEDQSTAWNLWRDYRQELNDEGIDLDVDNDQEMSIAQYKETHPICEATGMSLLDGGGSLAHIKSRGSDTEEHSNFTSNWLHLSDLAHAEWDNGNGRESFLKKYPHLKRKIENALGKEYPQRTPTENVDDKKPELDLF